jgi:hypothetical protein
MLGHLRFNYPSVHKDELHHFGRLGLFREWTTVFFYKWLLKLINERERKWKKAACIWVVEEGERGEW